LRGFLLNPAFGVGSDALADRHARKLRLAEADEYFLPSGSMMFFGLKPFFPVRSSMLTLASPD
jgi:hypothetical protein